MDDRETRPSNRVTMRIELTADTAPLQESFEEGSARIIRLMRRLAGMPEFSTGWEGASGLTLAAGNEADFTAAARMEIGPDGEEIGLYFLIAGAPTNETGERSEYLLDARFGRDNGILPHQTQIEFDPRHANISFAKRLIQTLLDWTSIQHIGISTSLYRNEDTPLDFSRSGVGWAGWVPFQLTPVQVPEAVALEPLAGGTFLASAPRWAVSGDVPIAEAQALDLRLNSLGVLPTIDDLLMGDWGNGSSQP